jgi:phospholipid/cholesterol/gamma-HCH transport system substrate-binding protein
MLQMRTLELGVGAFMAVGLVALFFLALQVSNLSSLATDKGYRVEVRFDNIGGLKVKAPVKMAGVLIGRVSAIQLDNSSYDARVTLNIAQNYNKIPNDTLAKIYTAGLLGEQYIGLEAGGSSDYLADGSEISMTQSALVLEEVIGQFLFNKAGEGVKANTTTPAATVTNTSPKTEGAPND